MELKDYEMKIASIIPIVCSGCFKNHGLRLEAEKVGFYSKNTCSLCGSKEYRKLNNALLEKLAFNFFVRGTIHKAYYGAAPLIQFNEYQVTGVKFDSELDVDLKIFEKQLEIGFFDYGPRLWMVGEIEPLKQMQLLNGEEKEIFKKIIKEYSTVFLSEEQTLYRVRKNPEGNPNTADFDSPPMEYLGNGRLDSKNNPIFYCSTDLELCLHECRVSSEDQIYVGTFKPSKNLKLLDLSVILNEDCTEFESLDLSVLMLFLASQHAYIILQKLSNFIRESEFDGIIYPSYFSMLKTGNIPFETVIGLSNRRLKDLKDYEAKKIVKSIALFGYPLRDNKLDVISMNKLLLKQVTYDFTMAPIY